MTEHNCHPLCSFAGSLGAPMLYGSAPVQQSIGMPINGANSAFPAQMTPVALEPIGKPSECLLLKNMFDPTTEVEFLILLLFATLF